MITDLDVATPAEAPSIHTLLADFDAAFDKKGSLAIYLQSHPAVASALTPQDVGTIIGRVVFTFEKPGIAGTLAISMPFLRCEHVTAGMQVTSGFTKLDIAKAMHGYVGDPENVQLILGQLSDFELTMFKNSMDAGQKAALESRTANLV